MLNLSQTRIAAGLIVLTTALVLVQSSQGQGAKVNSKSVTFTTYDGVEISGTFYPNPGGRRQATVLLLHDFDPKSGGSSTREEGWAKLAAALQADGYAVLQFDFRGFGDSTTINAAQFWSPQFKNVSLIKKSGSAETLTYKNFASTPAYLPHLLHDIAAARAYLDRQNDQKNCNTSSLILIGAGKGATLGALWMMHEANLCRDRNNPPLLVPMLGEAEAKDLAAGIWLSISPSLNNIRVPVSKSLAEVSRNFKVPMVFVYGKNDNNAQNFSDSLLRAVKPSTKATASHLKLTGKKDIVGTKLAGEKLLGDSLETRNYIIRTYLDKVMEERREKEWVERKPTSSSYWYSGKQVVRPRIAKPVGQEALPVDLGLFGLNF